MFSHLRKQTGFISPLKNVGNTVWIGLLFGSEKGVKGRSEDVALAGETMSESCSLRNKHRSLFKSRDNPLRRLPACLKRRHALAPPPLDSNNELQQLRPVDYDIDDALFLKQRCRRVGYIL